MTYVRVLQSIVGWLDIYRFYTKKEVSKKKQKWQKKLWLLPVGKSVLLEASPVTLEKLNHIFPLASGQRCILGVWAPLLKERGSIPIRPIPSGAPHMARIG